MPLFPYLEIFKKAYTLARSHTWLWVFGLFLSGTSTLNSGIFNLVVHKPAFYDPETLRKIYDSFLGLGSGRMELFFIIAAGVLVLSFLFIALAALAFASIICATAKFTNPQPGKEDVSLRGALAAGRKFFWRILGLQILITSGFAALTVVLASPVVFLFGIGALDRALALLLLALAIFIPASFVFGFLHLYGPIFVVLYDRTIKEALILSFNLLRNKFKESIIMSAFLVGLSLLFIIGVIFSIIVLSLPFALLIWLAAKLQVALLAQILTGIIILLSTIIAVGLNAGFAVFQSISWVLAVQEMVRTLKLQKEEKALAPEAAGAE
ncbi:MAG: hypothetical protein Q8R08_03075 [bacterium]|nr:hypothetical protein [bacterium]